MTRIRLEKVTQRYGDTLAVDAVDLEIASGELLFLLGPSGCGKSTLLRLIAGLQAPASGRIFFDEKEVTSVPTQDRNAVMCFQGYALWPHMSVRENVRFGLSVRQPSERRSQADQVERTLGLVRMTGALSDRKPPQLSGGQQQRVALARALAVTPACLLLDEPLSNLDTDLRLELRREIRRICKEAGITTLYVTHDQEEALSTADRIGVMQSGRLLQVGSPRELYQSPANAFVARFIGPANLIEGEVSRTDGDFTRVSTSLGPIVARASRHCGPVVVSLRPESIRIAGNSALPGLNRLAGTITESSFLGQSSEHLVAVGTSLLRVLSVPPVFDLNGSVELEFDPADAVVLPR
jgi:iron(III) transport system ATP-binding protein